MSKLTPSRNPARDAGQSNDGIVLVLVVALLGALTVVGATVMIALSLDIHGVDLSQRATSALHMADAGTSYVLSRARADEDAGTLVLDDAVEPVNYGPPPGYDFEPVTNLVRMASQRMYTFRVTANDGPGRATVEAVIGRRPALSIGAFGHEKFTMQSNTKIYGYRSSRFPLPTVAQAGVGGPVATNGDMTGDDDAVDGTIHLGEDEFGNPATYSGAGSTTTPIIDESYIDPDPLGLVGGPLAQQFAEVALTNDNGSAMGGTIAGAVLTIDGDVTLTAGNYYVDEIDIGAHETLTIDASAGPVSIFLTGPANMQPNSLLPVSPPLPSSLRIYSNSPDTINMQPNLDFIGFIYAPLAVIQMMPGSEFHGLLWGRELMMKPNGAYFLDEDFRDMFTSFKSLEMMSWKQVSN